MKGTFLKSLWSQWNTGNLFAMLVFNTTTYNIYYIYDCLWTTKCFSLFLRSSGIVHYSFSNLKPGRSYVISIATIDGGVKSDQASVTMVTNPQPVEDFNVTSHDPTTLNIEWRVTDPQQQHHFLVWLYCVLCRIRSIAHRYHFVRHLSVLQIKAYFMRVFSVSNHVKSTSL